MTCRLLFALNKCATDSGLVLEVGLLRTLFLPAKKEAKNKTQKTFFALEKVRVIRWQCSSLVLFNGVSLLD